MSLEQLTKEELKEMSMIELAYEILDKRKQPIPFNELLNEIKQLLELTDEEVRERIAQFYTDVNIDGRFMNVGGNTWGISAWYPIEQVEDDIVPTVTKKKKKSKAVLEDEDELDYEDLEDEDFDELDDFEDEDIEEDEDEFLDEDEDEDIEEVEDDFDDDFEDEEDDLLVEDEFEEEDEDIEDELDEYIAEEDEEEE